MEVADRWGFEFVLQAQDIRDRGVVVSVVRTLRCVDKQRCAVRLNFPRLLDLQRRSQMAQIKPLLQTTQSGERCGGPGLGVSRAFWPKP